MARLTTMVLFTMMVCGIANTALAGGLSHDSKVVAATILAEAKGEGYDGMRAVACVIKQRMIEQKKSATAICLQKKQFSCWNSGPSADALYARMTRKGPAKINAYAEKLAVDLVSGKDLDRSFVGYANHYCRIDCYPKWAQGKKVLIVIGHHRFLKF